jgi:protoheme IX farnesyltransferase
MSTSTLVQVDSERSVGWWGRAIDYVELSKPRILMMVLITVALAGLVATWGQPDVSRLLHTILGTAFVAASASILNQWLERDTDAQMRRTENRPLPSGRLTATETFVIGLVTVLFGLAYLINLAGSGPTLWAGVTWLLYVGVYTPLKRRTWLNTLIGAVPGALPVLIGWTGAGGALDTRAACLFLLVFLWQFPHFMAIAWLYRHQYAAAGMQMLTVVDPTGRRPGNQAIIAAFSVLVVSFVPAALVIDISWVYLAGSAMLGIGQIICAWQFAHYRDDAYARKLLRASLLYLPAQLVLITLLNLAVI